MNYFARKDLLVAICCLVFLGLLASSWLGRSGRAARRAGCTENMRQLLKGFEGFANDYGKLPTSGRVKDPKESDWIYWQKNRVLKNSALATNFAGFSEALRCPGDRQSQRRDYSYSYTMNVHLEQLNPRQLTNTNDVILLLEEGAPNDGACVPGLRADRLSRRHAGWSNAGFLDGQVKLIKERDLVYPLRVIPLFSPQSTTNAPPEGPPTR